MTDRWPPINPEPCDDCDTGIAMFVCYDGIRRCRNCVHALAAANGWDQPPDPPTPPEAPSPKPPPPPPPPLRPLDRKALREEKEMRASGGQGVLLL